MPTQRAGSIGATCAIAFLLLAGGTGCASTRPAEPWDLASAAPAGPVLDRTRISAEDASRKYPIEWRPTSVQYASAEDAVARPSLTLRGNLRLADPDGFVGLSLPVVTALEGAEGQPVAPPPPAPGVTAYSTVTMRHRYATAGFAPVEVPLPRGATAFRRVAGHLDAVVIAAGRTTEFPAGVTTGWSEVGSRIWLRITRWSRDDDDGADVVEFGVRLPSNANLEWIGEPAHLRLPLVVATELVRDDAQSEMPLARTCGGGGIPGGLVEMHGTMRFGIGKAAPKALRVRVAERVRVDEIPFEAHDVTAR